MEFSVPLDEKWGGWLARTGREGTNSHGRRSNHMLADFGYGTHGAMGDCCPPPTIF